MAAVLMQASATVWSGAVFPPHCSGFTAANLSHAQCWEKKWRTFVKCSFHKAAIVERSQDQNDNVDSGYCLPTGPPAAAVHSSDLQPLTGLHWVCASLRVFTCIQVRISCRSPCVCPLTARKSKMLLQPQKSFSEISSIKKSFAFPTDSLETIVDIVVSPVIILTIRL